MSWGPRSRREADTTHPEFRAVAERVDKRWPCTFLNGERSDAEQEKNVARGVSKTRDSLHLPRCSREPKKGVDAGDIAPDPLGWPDLQAKLKKIDELLEALARDGLDKDDRHQIGQQVKDLMAAYAKELGRWYAFAGYFHGVADEMYERGEITVPLEHGYDWDGDHRLDDQRFDDLAHHHRKRP